MSQSSELEEGEHASPAKLVIPSEKTSNGSSCDVEENDHMHKMYTRGVGALLGGMMGADPKSSKEIHGPHDKARIPLPEHRPLNEMRGKRIVIQRNCEQGPRIISIERQLDEIRSVFPEAKLENESGDEKSDDEMKIEEDNVIEVNKKLGIAAVQSVTSLGCPLCDERFQHPRMLSCLHTFCSSCIQKRINEDNRISCPICLRQVKLPLPTVDLLPTNNILDKFVKLVEAGESTELDTKSCSTCEETALFWCVECQTDFCEKCKKVHLNIKAVSNHKLLTRDEVQQNFGIVYTKTENCKEHTENELNLYCETCDELICRDCTLIDHKVHSYGFLQERVAAKRRKLQEEVERGRSKLVPLKKLITAVEEDIKDSDNDEVVKQQIKSTTEAVIAHVRAQEKQLLDELSSHSTERSDRLRQRYKELQYAVNSSQSSLDYLFALIKQGDMKDLVSMAPSIRTRVAEITAYRPEVELNRVVRKFKSHPLNKLPQIGVIFGTATYDAVAEHPHLIGSEGSGPGEFRFPTGLAFHPSGYIVVVDRANTLQVFEMTGSIVREITRENEEGNGKLKNPNGVAVDNNGYFYVADSSKHRIAVYNPKGKYSHEIGARGSSSLKTPSSLPREEHDVLTPVSPVPRRRDEYEGSRSRDYRSSPYSSSSDLYYSSHHHYHRYPSSSSYYRDRDYRDYSRDYYRESSSSSSSSRRRESYDRRHDRSSDLEYPAKKMKANPADTELNGPRGVAISSKGLVVVADTTNHCVKIFTREGTYIRTVGEEGAKAGQMRTPSGVSLDTNDNIYVTDTELHRITVFSITGEYVHHFGKKGSENGEFLFPSDIAVDQSNNVFVCDCDNNRVQIFDKEGQFIRSVNLDRAGTTMKKPLAVAVDLKGNVAVCDTGHHRVWLL